MKWERIVFLKKIYPQPPTKFFFYVGNSMKRDENLKYWKHFFFFFFSIFKKFIKNSNNIPSISKTIQHTPMTWCTYLQSFEKIHQCVLSYSAKTKHDGRTDRQTDGGRCNISRPGPSAPREIIKGIAYIFQQIIAYNWTNTECWWAPLSELVRSAELALSFRFWSIVFAKSQELNWTV